MKDFKNAEYKAVYLYYKFEELLKDSEKSKQCALVVINCLIHEAELTTNSNRSSRVSFLYDVKEVIESM